MAILSLRAKRSSFDKHIACGALLVLMAVSSCSEDPVRTPACTESLPANVQPTLSIGFEDATNTAPNVGQPVIDIFAPTWMAENQLLVYTGLLVDGVDQLGVYRVQLDPATLAFRSMTRYSFAHPIVSMEYLAGRDRLLMTYLGATGPAAVLCRLDSASVVVEEVLVPPAWNCVRVRALGGGYVAYATDPSDGVSGFYLGDSMSGPPDSLILDIDLSLAEANAFDVAANGEAVVFGERATRTSTLNSLALDGTVTVLAPSVPGLVRDIDASPVQPDEFLVSYQFPGDSTRPPRGHVVVISAASGASTSVPVGTTEALCHFLSIHEVAYSPDGGDVVYSSSSYDGEGSSTARELWIRR